MTADWRQDVMKVRCTSEVQRLVPMMDFAQVVHLAGVGPIICSGDRGGLFVQGRLITRKVNMTLAANSSYLPNSTVSQELLSGIGSYCTAIVSII